MNTLLLRLTSLRRPKRKSIALILIAVLLFTAAFAFVQSRAQADSIASATGKVNASGGAYLRAKATTKSDAVKLLKDNTKLTINKEVFVKKGSTKATNRWYQVTVDGKNGYIRSDLVDGIGYKQTAAKTTDALNYRIGPSSDMTKKGYFKKNSTIAVVLKASMKTGEDWYKVRVGNNYYYACAEWVKTGVASVPEQVPKSSSNTAMAANATDIVPEVPIETPTTPVFEVNDISHPTVLLEGMRFGLSGTITCNIPIEKVRFGIINSKSKWVFDVTRDVNSESFNVGDIDSAIKFGSLKSGTYTYRGDVYVNGKAHTKVSYKFTVRKGSGGERLASTAIQLAWPKGTSKSTYKKKPTAAYKTALATVYPEHNKWKKGARTGASCDVFVGTVCRYSGIDPDMPRTVGTIWNYLPEHPEKWVKVDYGYKESDLRDGDIIIYYYKGGRGQHVCMYVTINGKGYIAEANYPSGYYGFINGSKAKLFRSSDKKKFAVYRYVGETKASVASESDGE